MVLGLSQRVTMISYLLHELLLLYMLVHRLIADILRDKLPPASTVQRKGVMSYFFLHIFTVLERHQQQHNQTTEQAILCSCSTEPDVVAVDILCCSVTKDMWVWWVEQRPLDPSSPVLENNVVPRRSRPPSPPPLFRHVCCA